MFIKLMIFMQKMQYRAPIRMNVLKKFSGGYTPGPTFGAGIRNRAHSPAKSWLRACDLDLYFQGHYFLNVNILKTMRVGEKCSSMAFIEVDNCHRMGPL